MNLPFRKRPENNLATAREELTRLEEGHVTTAIGEVMRNIQIAAHTEDEGIKKSARSVQMKNMKNLISWRRMATLLSTASMLETNYALRFRKECGREPDDQDLKVIRSEISKELDRKVLSTEQNRRFQTMMDNSGIPGPGTELLDEIREDILNCLRGLRKGD